MKPQPRKRKPAPKKHARSAVTGHYVSADFAKRHPRSTVWERIVKAVKIVLGASK